MSVAETLRHLADMSEQDPDDLHRIIWRLDVLRDDIRQQIDAKNASFVDDILKLGRAA